MTTDQKIAQLRERTSKVVASNILQIAAQDTHVKMTERIFVKGHNAQDAEIGTYNTTNELYVNPNNAPKKFRTKGKSGDENFKNGKPHKTGYFKSYSDYRGTVGRESSKVNLNLFGALQSNFGKAVEKVDNNKYASTVNGDSSDKIRGAESRYGNIFRLTPKERTNFKQVLAAETFKILKGAK